MTTKKSYLYFDLTEKEKEELRYIDIDALMNGYRLRAAFGNAIFPTADDEARERQDKEIERRSSTDVLKGGWK